MHDAPTIALDAHPLLDAAAFVAELPRPLGETASPPELLAGLKPDFAAPLRADDAVRAAVRDVLRHGGFKPTGRSKPASEYLLRAAGEGGLGGINLVVDACNVASLHAGLPISVVDLDRARAPFRIGVAETGASYVFNASGQEIDVGGLVLLFDAEGPCANAVKDSQRTKTHAGTTRVLAVVWGARALAGRAAATAAWYRRLLEAAGAKTAEAAVG
jgi:DNA/RNA-binding domain of Phe-tRNA-synthetase-like protein